MNKEDKDFETQLAEAQEADRKIKFCAFYVATKGMTAKTSPGQVMKLFSELKIRLAKGSWRSLSHMKADLMLPFSVSKEKRG